MQKKLKLGKMALLVRLWPTHFLFPTAKASVSYTFVSAINFHHFRKCSPSSRDFPLQLVLCNPNHLFLNYIAFIWGTPTQQSAAVMGYTLGQYTKVN